MAAPDVIFFVDDAQKLYRSDRSTPLFEISADNDAAVFSIDAITVNSKDRELIVGYQDFVAGQVVRSINRYSFDGILRGTVFEGILPLPFSSLAYHANTDTLYVAVADGSDPGRLYQFNSISNVTSPKTEPERYLVPNSAAGAAVSGLNAVAVDPLSGNIFRTELDLNSNLYRIIDANTAQLASNTKPISGLAYFSRGGKVVYLLENSANSFTLFLGLQTVPAQAIMSSNTPNLGVKNSDSSVYAIEQSKKIRKISLTTAFKPIVFDATQSPGFSSVSNITALAVFDGGGDLVPDQADCDTADTDGDGLSECDGDQCPNNSARTQESHCRSSQGDRCDVDIVYDEPIAISCKSQIECPGVRELLGACGTCSLPYVEEGGDTSQCVACDEAEQLVNGSCQCIEQDGEGNCVDLCPGEAKIRPTDPCGCAPDIDTDGDGVFDCVDECPERSLYKERDETCGCQAATVDSNGNTICGNKATIPIDRDALASKIIRNPVTGEQLVPERPAVSLKEKCSKEKGCLAKF
ncbi:MAG: hypothetical protein KDD62_12790, partial [Bdellovibrionales bacterium]|nr:hypothetical protein [Bdellovibrionales bacterium]